MHFLVALHTLQQIQFVQRFRLLRQSQATASYLHASSWYVTQLQVIEKYLQWVTALSTLSHQLMSLLRLQARQQHALRFSELIQRLLCFHTQHLALVRARMLTRCVRLQQRLRSVILSLTLRESFSLMQQFLHVLLRQSAQTLQ